MYFIKEEEIVMCRVANAYSGFINEVGTRHKAFPKLEYGRIEIDDILLILEEFSKVFEWLNYQKLIRIEIFFMGLS
jgi:hypothetical protein